MLNFVRFFFCNQLIWSYDFSSLACWCGIYINWFLNIGPALYTWHKSHLVMAYNSFYTLLDLICKIFWGFYICIHEWHWSVLFLSCNVFIWYWFLYVSCLFCSSILPLLLLSFTLNEYFLMKQLHFFNDFFQFLKFFLVFILGLMREA